MFRGNPTRSWYGTGPLPQNKPKKLWRYPSDKPLCAESTALGKTKKWCGSGWTGQPVVWERQDGVTEIIVGTYDKAVHFIDAETGKPTRNPFPTGDIIKGSVSIDPDGFPLLYFGSRDNKFRILSLDEGDAKELFSIEGQIKGGLWNNDWDGNAIILNDFLIEGGENSWFYTFKLNRGYDSSGKVKIAPQKVVQMKGWTDQLLKDVGDKTVSIESSAAAFGNYVYYTNSGGLVTGLDMTKIKTGEAYPFFRFWAGDDIDASPVIDSQGMVYVAAEYERKSEKAKARADEVGQLIKLNPMKPDDPVVWSVKLNQTLGDGVGGIWATPALDEKNKVMYVPTHTGKLLAVNTDNGQEYWRINLGLHEWSSPVVIENNLLLGLCHSAGLAMYDVTNVRNPVPKWTVKVGGCVESTPAVWKGKIYVGSRDGYIYAFGE
jgi:outer membrane protein assembly factor BamB